MSSCTTHAIRMQLCTQLVTRKDMRFLTDYASDRQSDNDSRLQIGMALIQLTSDQRRAVTRIGGKEDSIATWCSLSVTFEGDRIILQASGTSKANMFVIKCFLEHFRYAIHKQAHAEHPIVAFGYTEGCDVDGGHSPTIIMWDGKGLELVRGRGYMPEMDYDWIDDVLVDPWTAPIWKADMDTALHVKNHPVFGSPCPFFPGPDDGASIISKSIKETGLLPKQENEDGSVSA